MASHRLLILASENEPRWVRVYLQEIEGRWAAMMVGDDGLPPEPGALKGVVAFFGATPEEAGWEAKATLQKYGGG